MTNQLSALPWKIDVQSDTPFYLHPAKISHVDYVSYTGATDVAELQDMNGNIVAFLSGNADLSVVTSYAKVGWVDGLKLPLLTTEGNPNMPSGFLLIYIK